MKIKPALKATAKFLGPILLSVLTAYLSGLAQKKALKDNLIDSK